MNTPQNTAAAPASAGLAFPASGQAWYLVFVLLIFYIFSFIDRQIIALLVEPMKRDLHISDTLIGLMQGLAFAVLYCTLGIPLGRLADSRNRKSIIAGGILVWSFMATMCGLSSVYLFTINLLGVGVGPFLVPFISDHVLHDPMQIRWALAIVIAFAGTIAAILLWRARGVYREKVAATAEWL